MGKRGPKGVPEDELTELAREIYWRFASFQKSQVSFDRGRYKAEKEKFLESFAPLKLSERHEIAREIAKHQASLTGDALQKEIENSKSRVIAGARLRQFEHAYKVSRRRRKISYGNILDGLLTLRSAAQVRRFCDEQFKPDQMAVVDPLGEDEVTYIKLRDPLAELLTFHAEAFISALRDNRFPKSSRKSSRKKRLWFLARVLAGAKYGLKARTAIDRIKVY